MFISCGQCYMGRFAHCLLTHSPFNRELNSVIWTSKFYLFYSGRKAVMRGVFWMVLKHPENYEITVFAQEFAANNNVEKKN